jgi:hypothetical protein
MKRRAAAYAGSPATSCQETIHVSSPRSDLSVPVAFPNPSSPQGVASVPARDLAHLHYGKPINKQTALVERGNIVQGRGDQPNAHDILTGRRADGTAFAPQTDTTCKAWTSSGDGSGRLYCFAAHWRGPVRRAVGGSVNLRA